MTNGQENQGISSGRLEVPSGDPEKCECCDYFMICRIRLQENTGEPCSEGGPVQHKRINKGQDLFEVGKPFAGLYVVTDGALKSAIRTSDGTDEVVGFHFPGEYVGLEAFGNGFYSSTVQALETSWYCGLDISGINRIGGALVDLQSEIIRNLSLDTRHFQWRCQHMLRATVDQRLASTLLEFARRLGSADTPLTRFRLPMSRRDIANYLGMAPETLYRTLRRLADEELIAMDGRIIEILTVPRLIDFAGQIADTPLQSSQGSAIQDESTHLVAESELANV